MTTYTRNDVWRIKRCQGQLEKALDHLTRAGGELRPRQFDEMRKPLHRALGIIEATVSQMQDITEAPAPDKRPTLDLDDDIEEAAE